MKTSKITLIGLSATLLGCTHGSISELPIEVQGVGTVYRYQGRANFAHQITEADKMITEDCLRRNGGRPVIVDLQKTDLGYVAMGNATSNTNVTGNYSGNRYGGNLSGNATTNTTGSVTKMRNFNQEILYKCVKD